MASRPATSVTSRLPALDGLRGLAAAIVVLHHVLLTVPILAAPYFTDGVVQDPTSVAWWLTYSPLHVFWNGTAAVYVFFVLSGVVLTLPTMRARSFDWVSYYPQRLFRLYLPVWAALLLAISNITLIPRSPIGSSWLSNNTDPINRVAVANDVGLMTGHGFLMSPLWSLHWEVLFSLLLPVFVWLALTLGRTNLLLIPIALALISVGAVNRVSELEFLPMFLIGTVIATHLGALSTAAQNIRPWIWTVVTIGSTSLISTPWIVRGLGAPLPLALALEWVAVAAAAGLVVAAIHARFFGQVLRSRPLQYFGRISFSWYLVHEPIVIGVAFLTGTTRPLISIPVSIVTSIALAELFYRFVERPSHRLARKFGRLAQTTRESVRTKWLHREAS